MRTQFIRIPRKFLELDKGTKFIDVLVYAALEYQKDGTTGKSRISMRTIAEKYNIALSKIEDAVKRLTESGYIEYTQYPSPKNKDYVFNEYSFPYNKKQYGYLKLKPELLTQNLKPKDRGLLIYLQLIAVPNMNDIAETKIEDIAKQLKITRQTTSKYLKYFLDIEQISKGKHFYKCKYLAKEDKPETKIETKPISIIL